MIVLKHKGSVYGAKLTAAEKKAMDIEIEKQIAEYDRQHERELQATVLWVLMDQFRFGEKRLRRFFDSFNPALESLIHRYEMDQADEAWLCLQKLEEKGIDLEQWEKEGPLSAADTPSAGR